MLHHTQDLMDKLTAFLADQWYLVMVVTFAAVVYSLPPVYPWASLS